MNAKTANARQLDILGNANCSSEREIFAEIVKQWGQKLGYWSIFAAVPVMLASHVTGARSGEVKKAKKPETSVTGRDAGLLERLNTRFSNPALLKRQSEYRLPHQKDSFDLLATLGGSDDCPGRDIPAGTYTAAAPYTDSGNTTGANNTVTRARSIFYCFYIYDFPGADHIYSFTLTSRGANPQIQISSTSATYEPAAYILDSRTPDGRFFGCPAGTGIDTCGMIVRTGSGPGGTATISSEEMKFLPLNVPLYLFVDSSRNDALSSGPYTIRIQDATIAPTPGNSIDVAEFFIRQHYSDFLNREPDAGGLAYWTNEITQCGSDTACIHRRRIGISAAFFIESEFQENGYYVYRLYKASFGRQPTLVELTSDRAQVVGGGNLGGMHFANHWVQRAAFLQAYPNTMSNTEFVNKLFDTAGLSASRYNAQRQQEIANLNAGRSRAVVLRDVIEIPDFRNVPDPTNREQITLSQFNQAFVLMQYFGYLRRDPDPGGYDFWLNLLNNREPNNYSGMVCAFITSAEYQLRFGAQFMRTNRDCSQ